MNFSKDDFKILYIDDEPRNLEMFEIAFKREYHIITCSSAKDALEILKNEGEIPIIITDQRMPEMTGIEFLGEIITDFPDTIRMILTGFTDIEALIDAINTGRVFRYIVKPWNKEELRQVLKGAFENYFLTKENKRLITELQDKNKTLTDTLNELKITQDVLVEKEKKAIIGDLTAGLIHEIKNQLNTISFLDFILNKIPPGNNKQEKIYAKYIYDSRDRMLSLMDELRSLAKNQDIRYQFISYNLNNILDEAITIGKIDPDVKNKNISLQSNYDGNVMINKNKILQVLLNLIRNAAHAVDNDGEILIKTEKNHQHVIVHVIDNGVGMPKETLNNIWSPFFTTKGEKGTGLGLIICKRIIEGHKGEITCSSEPQVGTQFSFTIPLSY